MRIGDVFSCLCESGQGDADQKSSDLREKVNRALKNKLDFEG
jgi:hypothetical protein